MHHYKTWNNIFHNMSPCISLDIPPIYKSLILKPLHGRNHKAMVALLKRPADDPDIVPIYKCLCKYGLSTTGTSSHHCPITLAMLDKVKKSGHMNLLRQIVLEKFNARIIIPSVDGHEIADPIICAEWRYYWLLVLKNTDHPLGMLPSEILREIICLVWSPKYIKFVASPWLDLSVPDDIRPLL